MIYVLHELENNMHSTVVGGGVLYMSIKSCWLMLLGSSIFCLVVILIVEKGIVASTTVIVDLSIFLFNSIGFSSQLQFYCFVNTYIDLGFLCVSDHWSFLNHIMSLSVSVIRFFALKSIILYLIVTYALLLSFV